MFNTLKRKILISIISLITICTMAYVGISFYSLKTAVTNQMKNDGTNLVTVINREISRYNFSEGNKIETVLKEIKNESKGNISYISLSNTNLKIVASTDNHSKENADSTSTASVKEEDNIQGSIKEGKTSGYVFETENGNKVYNVSTPYYENNNLVGTISIGISLAGMNEMINEQIVQTSITALIILIISIIVSVFIAKNITVPITNVISSLDYFAEGDFTVEFNSNTKDETKKLTDALNKSIGILKEMIGETKKDMDELSGISKHVKTFSEKVKFSSNEVSESITDIVQSIQVQNTNVNNVSKSLESFSISLSNIKEKVESYAESSITIEETADLEAIKLKGLVKSIEEVKSSFGITKQSIQLLNEGANKIGEIMDAINNVAEQTNLLALNAAIEAARAGDAGKGFSVVAQEIQKLAEQVVDSSKSINGIVEDITYNIEGVSNTSEDITQKIDNQFSEIESTMSAFLYIQAEVHKSAPEIKDILKKLKEVSKEEEYIKGNAHELAEISQEIAITTDAISASIEGHSTTMDELLSLTRKIDDMTYNLNKNLKKFKI